MDQQQQWSRNESEHIDLTAIQDIITKCTTPPPIEKGRLKPLFGNDIKLEEVEMTRLDQFLKETETQILILQNDDPNWGDFRDKLNKLKNTVSTSLESFVLDIENPEVAELRKAADPTLVQKNLGLKLRKLPDGSFEKGEARYLLAPKTSINTMRLVNRLNSVSETLENYQRNPATINGTSAKPFAESLDELTSFMSQVKK